MYTEFTMYMTDSQYGWHCVTSSIECNCRSEVVDISDEISPSSLRNISSTLIEFVIKFSILMTTYVSCKHIRLSPHLFGTDLINPTKVVKLVNTIFSVKSGSTRLWIWLYTFVGICGVVMYFNCSVRLHSRSLIRNRRVEIPLSISFKWCRSWFEMNGESQSPTNHKYIFAQKSSFHVVSNS